MTLSAWFFPGIGLLIFAAGAVANADVLLGWSKGMRAARREGRHVSMAMFVPGVIGAIAMWNGPLPWMPKWCWLPLLLDVSCIPYVFLMLLTPQSKDEPASAEVVPESSIVPVRTRHPREASQAEVDAVAGCLLGTAIGDALGLPAEGLSPRRQHRLFADPARYHFLPFGYGMCSDDTEHTIMVAQALIETAGYARAMGDAHRFRANLAWRLRGWLLALPAGIGWATLKGILKLWLFLPARWQGSYSAGNGPAMRSALIGVFWHDDPALLRLHVEASTQLTHTDPKASQAALAIAVAAARAAQQAGGVDPVAFAAEMRVLLGEAGQALADLIDQAADSVRAGQSTPAFAAALGLERGVSGYALHSVPVALHAWLAHPRDYRAAVLAAIPTPLRP